MEEERGLFAMQVMASLVYGQGAINGDAVEELRLALDEIVSERLWLGDKVRLIDGDEEYEAKHLNKLQDAFFLIDDDDAPTTTTTHIMMDDAEEDDDEMKEKIESFRARNHTIQSLHATHRANVWADIRKTARMRTEKEERHRIVTQRIKEMKEIYDKQQS